MSDYEDCEPWPVLNGLLLIAVLGVVVSTLIVTAAAGFTFEPEGPGPIELRQEAMSAAIGFVLLSLAAVAVRELGGARWLVILAAVAGLLCAWVSVAYFMSSAHGHDYVVGNPWWWVVRAWAVIPSTWPIVIVLVTSLLVLGRTIRGARRQPIR